MTTTIPDPDTTMTTEATPVTDTEGGDTTMDTRILDMDMDMDMGMITPAQAPPESLASLVDTAQVLPVMITTTLATEVTLDTEATLATDTEDGDMTTDTRILNTDMAMTTPAAPPESPASPADTTPVLPPATITTPDTVTEAGADTTADGDTIKDTGDPLPHTSLPKTLPPTIATAESPARAVAEADAAPESLARAAEDNHFLSLQSVSFSAAT